MKTKLTEEQFRKTEEFRKTLEAFLDSPTGEHVVEILRSFAEPTALLIAEAGSIESAYMTATGRMSALRKLQMLARRTDNDEKKLSLEEQISRAFPELPTSFTATTTE